MSISIFDLLCGIVCFQVLEVEVRLPEVSSNKLQSTVHCVCVCVCVCVTV